MHIPISRSLALLLTIAASASIGAAIASQWRRRQREAAHHKEHSSNLKTWENEGGNVVPDAAE
jgi:hypothetical protein